jgi:hypothetical protein
MAGMQYGSCLSRRFIVLTVEIHPLQVIDGIQIHTSEMKLSEANPQEGASTTVP